MMEVSEAEFSAYMHQLGPFVRTSALAVATSGGPDSLCLTVLLARWCHQYNCSLTALIVDHRLRHESTIEAQQTAHQLTKFGIHAVILTWQGDKPLTRIQEIARHMRYKLMLDWCQQYQHLYLFTGHHLQDQHETALWRLWRGSDIWGLAGISAQSNNNSITICRPLLQIPKHRLEQTLRSYPLEPVRDPSNTNVKFARVAVRGKLARLPTLPLIALGKLRERFEIWCKNFIEQHVTVSLYGYVSVDFKTFTSLSAPFQQFLLNHLISVIGNQAYPIGRDKLNVTIGKLTQKPYQIVTQGGCILYVRHHQLLIIREWINSQVLDLDCNQQIHKTKWDGRFDIIIYNDEQWTGLTISSLGEIGWQQICHTGQANQLAVMPYHARLALPVVWQNQTIISICHFPNMLQSHQLATYIVFAPNKLIRPTVFKALETIS